MTFKAGQSGNPSGRRRGTPNKRTELANLLESHAKELVEKTIELALGGDVNALRLCFERLIPKVTREPTGIKWPSKFDEESIHALEGEIVQAALDGRIAIEDADKLKKLIPTNPHSSRVTMPPPSIPSDPIQAAKVYAQFMQES